MIDPRDQDARRPDDDEYGPPVREPKLAVMVDILPVFRWLKKKFSKEVEKHDNNQ